LKPGEPERGIYAVSASDTFRDVELFPPGFVASTHLAEILGSQRRSLGFSFSNFNKSQSRTRQNLHVADADLVKPTFPAPEERHLHTN
jgi:hypothetical protein